MCWNKSSGTMISARLGQGQCAEAFGEVVGQGMQLQPHAIGGEAAAAQAGPDDRVLPRLDTLRMIFHYAANSLKNPVKFIAFAAFYRIVFTSITWNSLLLRPGRCKIPAPEDQRFFGAFFSKGTACLPHAAVAPVNSQKFAREDVLAMKARRLGCCQPSGPMRAPIGAKNSWACGI